MRIYFKLVLNAQFSLLYFILYCSGWWWCSHVCRAQLYYPHPNSASQCRLCPRWLQVPPHQS